MSEAAALKKAKSGVKLSAAVARSLREGTLVTFAALALMLFLSFITYRATDPSFANTGEAGPVGNWIGPIGAWLAGFFFFLFGRPAYLFPIMLGYAGWLVHKNQSLPDARSRINTLLRAAGFILTLLTSCGLATLHWDGRSLPQTAGGVLGDLVGSGSARGLSFLGATLLLLGLWFSGVALFLGVSWFDVMDKIGAWVLKGIEWVRARMEQKRELASGRERKQARQEVVREEQKKVASRPPPRIEAARPGTREKRACRARAAGAVVRCAEVERAARALPARRGPGARAVLLRRGVGGHVAPGRAQAPRFRRGG